MRLCRTTFSSGLEGNFQAQWWRQATLVVLGGHLAGALRLALLPLEREQLGGVDGRSQRLCHQLQELVGAELGMGMNETPRRGAGAAAAGVAEAGAARSEAAAAAAAVATRLGGAHKSTRQIGRFLPFSYFNPGRPVYATPRRYLSKDTHTRSPTPGCLDNHPLTSRAERAPKL